MKRKEFIKTCSIAVLGGTGLALFLQSCGTSNYYAQNTITNNTNQLIIKKSEFIKVEKEKQIVRKYILVKSEKYSHPICIYKLENDAYSAILTECTHNGCELTPNNLTLVCPCHGAEFSNKGIVQSPPAEQNLKSFQIKTDNENIYISL
jgi:Rieske Fe-S protein